MSDLNAISNGTVDEAKKALAGLSDDDLAELLKLENGKDDPRSTLVSAIEAQQASRISEQQSGEPTAANPSAKASAKADADTGRDGKPIKGPGDSVNRDSAANIDEGRKARLETMTKDFG